MISVWENFLVESEFFLQNKICPFLAKNICGPYIYPRIPQNTQNTQEHPHITQKYPQRTCEYPLKTEKQI
jgi:hypothetical protein